MTKPNRNRLKHLECVKICEAPSRAYGTFIAEVIEREDCDEDGDCSDDVLFTSPWLYTRLEAEKYGRTIAIKCNVPLISLRRNNYRALTVKEMNAIGSR